MSWSPGMNHNALLSTGGSTKIKKMAYGILQNEMVFSESGKFHLRVKSLILIPCLEDQEDTQKIKKMPPSIAQFHCYLLPSYM